ncbi:MAG: methyltransferase, partial [Alkalispirochaeta sp.]
QLRPWFRQGTHALALLTLMVLVGVSGGIPEVRARSAPVVSGAPGFGPWSALWTSIAIAVIHQLWVTVWWRMQIARAPWDANTGRVRVVPPRAALFRVYGGVFFLLFAARMASVVAIAAVNREQISISWSVRGMVTIGLALPAVWLFYSVVRYFGMVRASGADHFDPAAPDWPMEHRGVFRYTRNGMYTLGLLVLWIPGVLAASPAALISAAFQHAYIWVHYWCTELPDMRAIYGSHE